MQDAFADAANNKLIHKTAAMRSHDDQAGSMPFGLVDDGRYRFTLHEQGSGLDSRGSELGRDVRQLPVLGPKRFCPLVTYDIGARLKSDKGRVRSGDMQNPDGGILHTRLLHGKIDDLSGCIRKVDWDEDIHGAPG